jgi:hypothetical protein
MVRRSRKARVDYRGRAERVRRGARVREPAVRSDTGALLSTFSDIRRDHAFARDHRAVPDG